MARRSPRHEPSHRSSPVTMLVVVYAMTPLLFNYLQEEMVDRMFAMLRYQEKSGSLSCANVPCKY